MSLITELRRRGVFKVGAAYLVVAWLVIQVASTVAPQMSLPDWAPRLITLIMLLGFPVALMLAWALDVTPEGIRPDVSRTGNKRFYSVVSVLVVCAIAWYLVTGRSWDGAPAADSDRARSIAVLPFVNMSDDPANEYFSDGVSEEILNVLSRVPELRVAARTSSFRFKGEKRDVAQIAAQLKVGMVVEGSVRKQNDQVRITVQLIDAANGYHVWSQTYDRELKDIFAIQAEIATAIANELKVRLAGTPEAGQNATGTTDLVAYDQYLRAIALMPRRDVAELGRAVELLEQAVVLDAGFARGWAMLAAARGILGYYDIDIGLEHTLAITIDAAERALALDPQSGEAYAVLGLTAIHQGRYQTAVALLARSIKLTPSFAQAYSWQAGALRNVGQWEEAERVNHQALELDPYSYFSIAYLAFHFLAEGRTGEASELLQAKLAMDTNLSITHIELGNLALAQGDWAAAYAHYAHVVGDDQAALALLGEVFSALDGRGSKAEVAQLVTQQMYDALSPSAMSIRAFEAVVMTLIALGEMDAALSYIEQIAAMPAGKLRWRLAGFSLSSINVGQLRCEPRFQAVMTANGLVDGLAERICAKDPGESLPVQP